MKEALLMRNTRFRRGTVIFLSVLFVINLVFCSMLKDKDIRKVRKTAESYDFVLYSDPQLTHQITLPYTPEKNQPFDVYFRIPFIENNSIIGINARYQLLECYIDDALFYESELPVCGKIKTYAGRNHTFIPLRKIYIGRVVRMHIQLQKNVYTTHLSSLTLTDLESYIDVSLKKAYPVIGMALCLLLISLFTFFAFNFSYIYQRKRKIEDFKAFLYNFLISLTVVAWIISNFDVIGVIIKNRVLLGVVNYNCFNLMPVFFACFLQAIYFKKERFITYLRYLGEANYVIQSILFIAGIFDLTQMLFVTHFIDMLSILITLIVIFDIRALGNLTVEQKTMCIGTSAFALCSVVGLLVYVLNPVNNFMIPISFGLVIFFGTHTTISVIRLSQSIKDHASLVESERNSYKDQLTNLGNRRLYLEKIAKMEGFGLDPNINFIMMDVNGLKSINDTLGHDVGDELLKGAAVCILESFPDAEVVCRLGGDEFFIIVKETAEVLEKRIKRFAAYASNWNGTVIKSISIAYGIANLTKFPNASIHDLEKYADEEMYKNKSVFYSKKM